MTALAWAIAVLSAAIGLLFGGAALQRKRTSRQRDRREQAIQHSVDRHAEEMADERDRIDGLDPGARESAILKLGQQAIDDWDGR